MATDFDIEHFDDGELNLRYYEPSTQTLTLSVQSPEVVIPITTTGYFDASDAGPSDPGGVWTNDANAFNGNTTNYATQAPDTTSSKTSNYLGGIGTNATGAGTITQVRFRYCCATSLSGAMYATVYHSSEELGEGSDGGDINSYGEYVTLNAPTGGWDWTKVAALEIRFHRNNTSCGFMGATATAAEVEVSYITEIVHPSTQTMTLAMKTPTYNYDFVTKPSANSLTLTNHSPTLVLGDSIAPNALTLSLTQNVPSYILGETIIPLTRPMLLATKTPTIIGTANVSLDAQSLILSIQEPTTPTSETILPDALGMNLTQNNSNYITGDVITPAALTLTSSAKNPTISIVNPSLLQSELVYKNAIAVTQAKLTIISTSDGTSFMPYLSNDNGNTWESVTSGVTHIFSDPTREEVKYKIYASPGTVLTKVILKVN